MPVSSSSIPMLSLIVICVGVLIFLATLAPIRHSWTQRFKHMHGWFYHPDELKPEVGEEATSSPATLLDQVEIHGWNYDMYKEHADAQSPKP